jgi:crossover junction endodeoxyribonuclease RuvC
MTPTAAQREGPAMKILALDLGTKTGWAARFAGGAVESGTQVFDVRRGESPGMRYIRFRAWLTQMLDHVQPDLVAFEQAHHRGGAATEVAAGFSTRVLEFCAEAGIEHTSVHTATLKKHATGKGNAKKAVMIEAAEARWGMTFKSDDEADARCVLAWALERFAGEVTR